MAVESISALEFKPSMIAMGKSYLLLGADAWLIDSVLDPIRSTLRKRFSTDTVIIYGDEIKAPQLNDVLDTLSIFSTQKLVVLKNAEAMRVTEQNILASYVASPSDTQSLVIVAAKIDARFATWKTIRQGSLEIKCDPPRHAGMMNAWLENCLSKAERTMEKRAKELFLSKIELDYASAYNELQKLILLAGTSRTISFSDVERGVGTSRVGTMADFYRALGKRDIKSTLMTVQRMLDSEWEPLQVFFQFTKFFSSIHRILALRKNHITPAEICAKHLPELYPDQRKDYLGFAESYTLDSIQQIHKILLETDSALKLSMASGKTLLEICALRIMSCR